MTTCEASKKGMATLSKTAAKLRGVVKRGKLQVVDKGI